MGADHHGIAPLEPLLVVILGPTASGKTALSLALAQKFDVPGVSDTELFWTDEESEIGGILKAREVNEDGFDFFLQEASTNKTVCVTDPSA